MITDIKCALGYWALRKPPKLNDQRLHEYVNLGLMALGWKGSHRQDLQIMRIAESLLASTNNFRRLSANYNYNCPFDQRIIDFCERYFAEISENHDWIRRHIFITDCHGVARVLSLPLDADESHSEHIDSHCVYQGILHNPRIDKRPTKGVFHIDERGIYRFPR